MSDFDCDPLFSRLYLEMLEQMTAYSARRLGDIGLAEDVAQDTFAECWKNWEQGQRVKYHPNPRGWLWEALKIKLKKMREDMEKVRTVPLDELAHPPAAPVERRLYLSELPSTRHIPGGPADRPPPAGGLPLSGDRGKDGHDGDPVPGAPVSSEGEAEKI